MTMDEELIDYMHNILVGSKVVLIGNTKYKDTFFKIARTLEIFGIVVLMPTVYSNYDGTTLTEKELYNLKTVFKTKIELSDFAIVINKDIGKHTREDIKYAEELGKRVLYINNIYTNKEGTNNGNTKNTY